MCATRIVMLYYGTFLCSMTSLSVMITPCRQHSWLPALSLHSHATVSHATVTHAIISRATVSHAPSRTGMACRDCGGVMLSCGTYLLAMRSACKASWRPIVQCVNPLEGTARSTLLGCRQLPHIPNPKRVFGCGATVSTLLRCNCARLEWVK